MSTANKLLHTHKFRTWHSFSRTSIQHKFYDFSTLYLRSLRCCVYFSTQRRCLAWQGFELPNSVQMLSMTKTKKQTSDRTGRSVNLKCMRQASTMFVLENKPRGANDCPSKLQKFSVHHFYATRIEPSVCVSVI